MSRGKPGGRGASYDAGEPLFMYDLVLFLVVLWGVILFGSLLGFIPSGEEESKRSDPSLGASVGSGVPTLTRSHLHNFEESRMSKDISKTLNQLERLVASWSDDILVDMYWSVKEDYQAGQESNIVALTMLEREMTSRGIEKVN